MKYILNNLNLDKLGTLTVSARDGLYYVIDGQHRLAALREFLGDGWEDVCIEAWCWHGLTEAQEAKKFLEFNDVLTVDSFAKFKAGVTAKDPIPSDIDRIVMSLGLKVTRNVVPGSIRAVGALTSTYAKFGPQGLAKTLWIIREAFGDRGFESSIIEGVALFWSRYEGRVDPERVIKKLNVTMGGTKGVLNRAGLKREQTGQPVAQCVAAAITDIYNAGLRGTASLGSWWKDGKAVAS
ncbi:hypothetical protein IT072_02620 [Leifsonia sp. ZF2019]|nr:hypothetical protein IT072_02620 [Leifsonia sp. ZF2019]